MGENLSIFIVYLTGLGSFLSPCIIPLLPTYLSFMSGVALEDEKHGRERFKLVTHTLSFILGFGVAFLALQYLVIKFTNLASKLIGNDIIFIILGGVVIIMGLNNLGVFHINSLFKMKRIDYEIKKRWVGSSFIFGFAFGFGWTPCMGPILFTVMSLFAAHGSEGIGLLYMVIYILGLGTPFMLFALLGDNKKSYDFIRKHFILPDKVSGIIMIIFGTILAMNKLDIFLSFGFRDEIVAYIKSLFN